MRAEICAFLGACSQAPEAEARSEAGYACSDTIRLCRIASAERLLNGLRAILVAYKIAFLRQLILI